MGTVGYDHARIGQRWWVALPPPDNGSSHAIEVTKAQITQVPEGLKLLDYGAYLREETDGLALIAREGDKESPDFASLTNYADKPVRVQAKSYSKIYYLARFEVTGPINDNISGCRFEYRQGDRSYQQNVMCDISLRLEEGR